MSVDIQLKKIEIKYMKEVIDLLQYISDFKPNTFEHKLIFDSFSAQNDVTGYVAVFKENQYANEKLVGFGSLHMTRRIRGGTIGFIEDVAVYENFRKKGIGKLIIKKLIDKARKKQCFKVILDCKEDRKLFYYKIGFRQNGCSMTLSL